MVSDVGELKESFSRFSASAMLESVAARSDAESPLRLLAISGKMQRAMPRSTTMIPKPCKYLFFEIFISMIGGEAGLASRCHTLMIDGAKLAKKRQTGA